jgi:uncharacterized membrane protein YoaT (DUF817 family)
VFKTSSGVRSWAYPEFAYSKVLRVPLFPGFLYAAVGSYMIQAWRLLDVRIRHHPPYWMVSTFAIYANFFTHHYVGDYRWYIGACTLGLYARATGRPERAWTSRPVSATTKRPYPPAFAACIHPTTERPASAFRAQRVSGPGDSCWK